MKCNIAWIHPFFYCTGFLETFISFILSMRFQHQGKKLEPESNIFFDKKMPIPVLLALYYISKKLNFYAGPTFLLTRYYKYNNFPNYLLLAKKDISTNK
jgi:hypothetical protein